MTVMRPPSVSKTRPVTPSLAAEPSHTTSGETFSGAIASKPVPGAAMASAKAPLGHPGARGGGDGVDLDAVAGEFGGGDEGEADDAGLGGAVVALAE